MIFIVFLISAKEILSAEQNDFITGYKFFLIDFIYSDLVPIFSMCQSRVLLDLNSSLFRYIVVTLGDISSTLYILDSFHDQSIFICVGLPPWKRQ